MIDVAGNLRLNVIFKKTRVHREATSHRRLVEPRHSKDYDEAGATIVPAKHKDTKSL